MSIFDGIGNLANAANNASKAAKSITDKTIASANKASQNIQTAIKDSANGVNKKEIQAEKERRAEIENKLKGTTTQQTEIDGENYSLDVTRGEFDKLGDFNDVEYIEGIKIGSEIKDWLTGAFEEDVFEQQDDVDTSYEDFVKSKQEQQPQANTRKRDKILPENIQMANNFRESFENSQTFQSLINKFNSNKQGITNNSNTTDNYMLMETIISAYCGDTKAMEELDQLKNVSMPLRMSKLIRDCLDGKNSIRYTEQRMFLEMHGVDTFEIDDDINFSEEEIINLSVIKEMCGGASVASLVGCAPKQLSIIADAMMKNQNLSDVDTLSKYIFTGLVDSLYKEDEIDSMHMLNIRDDNDGVSTTKLPPKCLTFRLEQTSTGDAKRDILESNREKLVNVYEQKNDATKGLSTLICSVDEENIVREGSIDKALEIMKESTALKFFKQGDELTQEIQKKREQTHEQALANKLSSEELAEIKAEEDAALEEAIQRHGKFNFLGGGTN